MQFLGNQGRTVAVCVDQLEEAVTQCENSEERRTFLDLLVCLAQRYGERIQQLQ